MTGEFLQQALGRFGVWLASLVRSGALWRRPAVVTALVASAALNATMWIGLALALPRSPFPFTLHYTAALGADFFGERPQLFTIPAIGLLILGLNTALAGWLWPRERLLAAIVLGFTPFVQAGLAVGSTFLILANA